MVTTKILFLLSVFTIVIAVSRKPNLNGKLKVEKFQKELQLLAKQAHQAERTLNQRTFRLPNNTEPVDYNIRLSTDIHRGDFGFQGDVTINIRVLEASNSITLHSRHTIIERIDLFNANGTLFQSDLPFAYDSELHFLVIPVAGELEAGQELSIEISYQGFIRMDDGFFRNSFYDPVAEKEAWLATTQLSPINARQAFPCYDEPRYRRPIAFQIRHHRTYNAISNMPVAELEEDGEYVITIFEITPPIATYTFSFTVSNFEFVENTANNVTLRVYARPEAINLGFADDALRLADLLLDVTVNIFDIPYHLPKSDQVAIPRLVIGGFEGWGLITHSENIVLRFNDDAERQRFREIRIAHEYSHIYFGNMVTPSWWSNIWLSEGLATMYENIIVARFINHEENVWQTFLMEYFDQAITLDVMGLLPPLNLYAESPQEILDKFSFGTWIKAAVVLRMIGDSIGSLTWIKGVGYYLLNNEFGNVTPEDLFVGIQAAYDEDFPGSGLNFTELMGPWFDYEGYPVVTVRRDEQGLVLTQEGFRTIHEHVFPIPISYATASHPVFTNNQADFWMTSSRFVINRDTAPKPWTNDDWIILNLRDSSYYITNYDDDLWDLIIDALNNDHEAIHFLNRGTLFADFHRFIAQDFNVSIIFFLRMMESFPLENEPHVWNRAALGLNLAEVRIRGTEFHRHYMNFVQEIMSQIYGVVSFDDRSATDLINEWSCLSGLQECLDDALEILLEVMETGDTAYGFDYQCNGLRAANESVWMDFYFNVVDSRPPEERYPALEDLLCSENEDLVNFYLNQILNTTSSLSIAESERILTTAATKHTTSYNSLIDFIELNDEAVNAITSIPRLVLQLALVSNTYINTERTPWPGFITCQFSENSTYFCPLERPNFGSCSTPPAPNDFYCTEEGFCQCDYNYSGMYILIVLLPIILGCLIVVGSITLCYFCFCKTPKNDGQVMRVKTDTYKGSV